MTALLDTGFLLAIFNARDRNQQKAVAILKTLPRNLVLPAPVISELFYMVTTRIGYSEAVHIFDQLLNSGYAIEALRTEDMARMSEIMRQYHDAHFDFVDVAIMAFSERLNVTRVCTFDRRDFSIFRPKHCDALELLP